jgi:hypothetical protein
MVIRSLIASNAKRESRLNLHFTLENDHEAKELALWVDFWISKQEFLAT